MFLNMNYKLLLFAFSLSLSQAQVHKQINNQINKDQSYFCLFMPQLCPEEGAFQFTAAPTTAPTSAPKKPNLIMILTDEHNVRTIGSYREFWASENQKGQGYIWGDNNFVETPFIDSLATNGALFTNFYTVAPLCTPSRASFMTGLYPQKTGSEKNHGALDIEMKTFASVLKKQRDYMTSYFGKWHLNGKPKPGFGDNTRKFGFEDTHYQWNRGHWKFLNENNGVMEAFNYTEKELEYAGKEEKHYVTDFMFDRSFEFMDKAQEQNETFAFVLSIPDPHVPNDVRPPYWDLFKDMEIKLPRTAYTGLRKEPAMPEWNYHDHKSATLDNADQILADYESSYFYQQYMQRYFAMVKCIDDNVGRLLRYLKQSNLEDDTIIVFTSDHGNMAGEHGKLAKGRPYRTSAGIPFIIKYPGVIPKGKIVKTAHSSVDFAPSILSLMGVHDHGLISDGSDFTPELLNSELTTDYDNIIFTFDTGRSAQWAAAIKQQYKLVVSPVDVPWLFDLKQDPFEINNYFDDPDVQEIANELLDQLFWALRKQEIPLKYTTSQMFWSTPVCWDSKDRIQMDDKTAITCGDVKANSKECINDPIVQELCPFTCRLCCKNSLGKPFWHRGTISYCSNLKDFCDSERVQMFCPATCKQKTKC